MSSNINGVWFDWTPDVGRRNGSADLRGSPAIESDYQMHKERRNDPYFSSDLRRIEADFHLGQQMPIELILAFGTLIAFIGLHLSKYGQSQRKNATSAIIRVLVQMMMVPLIFWLVGFSLLNATGNAILNFNRAYLDGIPENDIGLFAVQCTVLLYLCATISSCSSQTMFIHIEAIMVLLPSTLTFPILANWSWSKDGWLAWHAYNDYGGSGPIHMVAFGSGLSLALFAGKSDNVRLIANDRYVDPIRRIQDEENHKNTKTGHDFGLYALGSFLHLFGLFACQLSMSLFHNETLVFSFFSPIILNMIVAASVSSMVSCAVSRCVNGVWSVNRTISGMFAGIAIVTCGLPKLEPWHCAVLGVLSALSYLVMRNIFLRLKISDTLETLSATGVNAFASLILSPCILFQDKANLVERVGMNIGVAAVFFAWSFLTVSVILWPLRKFKLLKQRSMFTAGLDTQCMREQIEIESYGKCQTNETHNRVDRILLDERRLMTTPRNVSTHDLRPSNVYVENASQTRIPPKYQVSNPRLVSTTSNVPVIAITSHSKSRKPSGLSKRSASLTTFASYDENDTHSGLMSMSTLPHPPLELLREESPNKDDEVFKEPEHLSRVSIHNQLKSLKPTNDAVSRRPSLTVRRELTPLPDSNNNNNNNISNAFVF